MSARHYVIAVQLSNFIPSKGLTRYDHCCCHPRAWGCKKGLRRARRRVGRDIIRQELKDY